jgi:hypothetical protein
VSEANPIASEASVPAKPEGLSASEAEGRVHGILCAVFHATLLTVVLSLAGAPSMVAWCLAACAPGAPRADVTAADGGHCDLRTPPGSDELRLVAGDSSHCGAPHESEVSLRPGKLTEKPTFDVALALIAVASSPAPASIALIHPADARGFSPPPGSFLTPLRI